MYLGPRIAKKSGRGASRPNISSNIFHILLWTTSAIVLQTQDCKKKSSREASRPNKSASKEINPRQRRGNLGNAQSTFQTNSCIYKYKSGKYKYKHGKCTTTFRTQSCKYKSDVISILRYKIISILDTLLIIHPWCGNTKRFLSLLWIKYLMSE